MYEVDLEELERTLRYRAKINSVDLNEIRWTRNGKPVELPQQQVEQWDQLIKEWGFIGLSNIDFARAYLIDNENLRSQPITIALSK